MDNARLVFPEASGRPKESGRPEVPCRMERKKKEVYILCSKKGNPRKHINVCRKCRYRKKCKAYQRYIQPELPFVFSFAGGNTKEIQHF